MPQPLTLLDLPKELLADLAHRYLTVKQAFRFFSVNKATRNLFNHSEFQLEKEIPFWSTRFSSSEKRRAVAFYASLYSFSLNHSAETLGLAMKEAAAMTEDRPTALVTHFSLKVNGLARDMIAKTPKMFMPQAYFVDSNSTALLNTLRTYTEHSIDHKPLSYESNPLHEVLMAKLYGYYLGMNHVPVTYFARESEKPFVLLECIESPAPTVTVLEALSSDQPVATIKKLNGLFKAIIASLIFCEADLKAENFLFNGESIYRINFAFSFLKLHPLDKNLFDSSQLLMLLNLRLTPDVQKYLEENQALYLAEINHLINTILLDQGKGLNKILKTISEQYKMPNQQRDIAIPEYALRSILRERLSALADMVAEQRKIPVNELLTAIQDPYHPQGYRLK